MRKSSQFTFKSKKKTYKNDEHNIHHTDCQEFRKKSNTMRNQTNDSVLNQNHTDIILLSEKQWPLGIRRQL